MKSIGRRKFLKNSVKASVGLFTGMNGFNFSEFPSGKYVRNNDFSVSIPMPIQVVIDDVGWWSGHDGSKNQEPYRTGILRNHVPTDYSAIVELGKALNIRPQAAMVLCEWDKENILRELPTATWMGKNWDNSRWIGPWMEEATDIIRKNTRHIELTLHGIGHEYWTDGIFTRAEWADVKGQMRPRDQVEKHLEFFEKIMLQHGLGPLPTSFVPTAFNHGFGITPGNDISIAEILSKNGIKYINTPFQKIHNAEEISNKYFGFDTDVLTIDRGKDILPWNATGVIPTGVLAGPTCGMHWANLIHPDPDKNQEIVNEWVQLLAPYNDKENTMLAPDSGLFQNQLLYYECTGLSINDNTILLDFKELYSFPGQKVNKSFILKVKSNSPLKFRSDVLKIRSYELKRTDDSFISTLKVERIQAVNKAIIKIL